MINRKAEILFSDDLFVDDSEFNEGLAKTNIGQYPNRIYGFYDRNGKVIIPPQFDDVSNFKNGFAIFRIGDENTGRLGFIDRTGKIVVNPVFKVEHGILNLTVFEFTEGLAAVKVSSEKGDLWGYIQAPNDNK
jgi:hypothetical protein